MRVILGSKKRAVGKAEVFRFFARKYIDGAKVAALGVDFWSSLGPLGRTERKKAAKKKEREKRERKGDGGNGRPADDLAGGGRGSTALLWNTPLNPRRLCGSGVVLSCVASPRLVLCCVI